MKDSIYFAHDLNARNDLKILKLRAKYGAEGYGVFWMIIEIMAENGAKIEFSDIPGVAVMIGIADARLSEIIDFCLSDKIRLFRKQNGAFYSQRIVEHEKRRISFVQAGKKGSQKRWGNIPPNSPPINPPINPPNANKKIKKERNKESGHEMTSEEQKQYIKPENLENLKKIFNNQIALKAHLLSLHFTESDIDLALGKTH